jgi:hypothetical protein
LEEVPVEEAPLGDAPDDEAPEVTEAPEEAEAVPEEDERAPELDGPLIILPPMTPPFWLGVPATLLR